MSDRQRTVKSPINCTGIGLHTGKNTRMTLRPAPADTGVVIVRTDLGGAEIPARYDAVCDTELGTSLVNVDGVRVGTVEHLMAALWGSRVDNVFVEIDGPEIPIMDGSAAPFVFLVECAGTIDQAATRKVIRLRRPIEVRDGDKSVCLTPADRFSVRFQIDFDSPVIGEQAMYFEDGPGAFRDQIGRARTFGFASDVAALHAAGLARGGSLDNAVVIGADRVLNEGGLRFEDEFVRHKILDCIGDFYLAGGTLLAHVEANCAGHRLNNEALRAVFADDQAWATDTTPARRLNWSDTGMAASA